MCNEESREYDSAVEGIEAGGGSGMELIGTVKAFDNLFKGAIGFRFLVEVLKADYLTMFKRDTIRERVNEMNTSAVRRIIIGDERHFLIFTKSADGFFDGADGRQNGSIVSDVIGNNLERFYSDDQKGVGPVTFYPDIGFITGGHGINRAFEVAIEVMAPVSSGFSVVEDGLVRDMDIENLSENESGFTC